MKTCSRCRELKSRSEFYVKNPRTGQLRSRCKLCQSQWAKGHYAAHKPYYKRLGARASVDRAKRAHDWVWTFLVCHPCVDCGEPDPMVLEFDHRDRSDKFDSVMSMVHRGFSLRKVMAEAEKCDIRCCNCHRRRTVQQFGWWRQASARQG